MTTVANALREGAARLAGDEARLEAELLLAHALERPRSWFYAHAGDVLGDAELRVFDALLRRRAEGEPVAQITGVRGFWSLELAVTRDTLIPRPETELLVELALGRLPVDARAQVLDLGTGTGAIALAIASERPLADVTAVDASQAALDVARANAADAGLPLRLLHGDWFAPVAGEVYRMIVSNPPYIAEDDPHLGQGDLRFEPRSALASGPDGLDALRAIIAGAPAHLLPGGWLLLEHGHEQGGAVRALLRDAGFGHVETARDLERRDRISLGQWPG
ncbi:peptide chain release factor N(5)-glutamine methyltransferase [Arenimonas caeni]|jgi:release factor glutamine methyltransferase|uniref:Release factor glutamine methyltransferase n=1 Tax=Arenimonas caeni TaxID=2058085 RepID=A0A2P6M6A6_9GAMM|nr:peptide chain release factor N(5)-glutamine methyltransferase [Arenimonas caeni]MDY0021109.1 peptide chain release factor N(5)-glutamine methyltransferase [Arenimonas caeni]PRH81541.1 peptide chain release factor N(5)-glutamine methyltransferase [Arenimonas caeni]